MKYKFHCQNSCKNITIFIPTIIFSRIMAKGIFYWCPQNNYSAIKLSIFQYCDSNIGQFSLAPCKVIALNLLYSFM